MSKRSSRPVLGLLAAVSAVALTTGCQSFASPDVATEAATAAASTQASTAPAADGATATDGPATAPTKRVAASARSKTSRQPVAAPTTTQSAAPVTPAPAAATAAAVPARYPFGLSSAWRMDVSSAPVDPNSSAMVGYLASQVSDRYGGVAAFNAHQYNDAYYIAPAGTPTVDVGFNDCQGKGSAPAGLLGPGGQFSQVPIPAGAVAANGTDKQMAVYSPATDQLWEFWIMQRDGAGQWSACWGGRIDHVSQSVGFFSSGFGASASGLACTGGTILLDDVRKGAINHAINLEIPKPAVYTRVSWPAQRSDGSDTDARAIPEGTRLRLDPSVDVNSLGLSPMAAMVAKAAQTYGFIVTDTAGAVAVTTESGAPEQAATGTDPWQAILGGTPDYAVMAHFPWDKLQSLPQNYGKS